MSEAALPLSLAAAALGVRRALSLARKPVWILVAAAAVSVSTGSAALFGDGPHGRHDRLGVEVALPPPLGVPGAEELAGFGSCSFAPLPPPRSRRR
jgi:hypothetical protein